MAGRAGQTATVVVVEPEEGEAATHLAGEGVGIERVDGGDEALDRLGGGPTPECLVIAGDIAGTSAVDLAASVRERAPDLPVILYPEEGSDALAAAASGVAGLRYLPRSADDDGTLLVERVRDAVDAFRDQRDRRRDARTLEAVLSAAPLDVYVKDREGRYVHCSDAAYDDMDLRDPIGSTEVELVRDEARRYARDALETDRRVVETGDPIVDRREAMFRDVEDEPTVHLRTTRVPWRDADGEVIGLIGFRTEVTEEVERERELRRARRRIERLAEFVEHDLRNPLTLARGYLEHAIDADEEAALREALAALDRLDSEIDQLLSSTRREVGIPAFDSVDLGGVAREAWGSTESATAGLTVDADEEVVVRADRSQLRTLLTRLFENAVAHGGPDVAVRLGVTDDGFVVDDDGPGLPQEERETVLEYGYTTAAGGTGVGLSTVAQIAERHGWTLSVEESPEGGTRFEVANCLLVSGPLYDRSGEGASIALTAAADLGGATPPGSSRYLPERDEWVLRGGGHNVWHNTDECHFRSATVEGDARIVGRLVEFDPVIDYSKAALVVRSAPRSGSPLGGIGLTAGGESEVLWREAPDRPIVTTQLTDERSPPLWYRVDRTGTTVTCYRSADGEEWVPIDQRRVDCGDRIAVGLLVSSLDPERCCTAVFDHVEVVDL